MPVPIMQGFHYRTTSLAMREALGIHETLLPLALETLRREDGIEECAILVTCNRFEVYVIAHSTECGLQALQNFYRQFQLIDTTSRSLLLLHDDVASHLCRVASGLDSMILGEGQILGQVKDALIKAHSSRASGPFLEKLFQTAIRSGKRIRTETGLDQKDASVAHAAFDLADQKMPDWKRYPIAVMGGGKMAQIILSLLKRRLTIEQQKDVTIINRSPDRLNELKSEYAFKGVTWKGLQETVKSCGMVFVATGAPHIVLGKQHFEHSSANNYSTVVIDLAVPRNVDKRVAELSHVYLFNMEDLVVGEEAEKMEKKRKSLYEQAASIIDEECLKFHQWQASLAVLPSINRLQAKIEKIRQDELAEHLTTPASEYRLIDRISQRLIKKILHEPMLQMKSLAASSDVTNQKVAFLSSLFSL